MKYFRLTTGMNGSKTSIRIEDVSAYSIERISGGMIRTPQFNVEIHMTSGTIFTSTMSEVILSKWEDLFHPSNKKDGE
tara:strand:- start:407 stop:640 length:234 start_codon:yes stop_codon:yes gene_type:complete